MNTCSSVGKLETPPGVDPSGKYLVIVNQDGVTRMLARPPGRSTLAFDGDDIYFVTGDDTLPWIMNNIPTIGVDGVFDGLMVQNGAGRIFRFVNETNGKKVLKSISGQIFFEDEGQALDGLLAPADGHGVVFRGPNETILTYLSARGVVYVDQDGLAGSIDNGQNGQIFKINAGVPTWMDMPSGNIASGVNSVGLEGVSGANIDNQTVQILAPTFTLTNGTDDLKVANVNISASLGNPIGLGGIDAGAETSNTWYYMYVISDGAAFAGIISLDPEVPDFGVTGYTYYALMSVFRNDGAGNIVDFLQRGRTFHIAPQLMSNDVSISTSFNAVPQSVPLSTILPPNVKTCSGIVGGANDAAGPVKIFVASTATKIGMQPVGDFISATTMESFKQDIGSFHDLAIADASAPVVYWRADVNNAKRRIVFTKYKI